jgi:FKBP-type peptidyl-prolyl cis-trans isomerase (trigger factor)
VAHEHVHHFKIEKIEKLPDSEAVITGEINVEFLTECRVKALEHLNKHFSLPGFRKGQIPEATLIKEIGEMGVLAETAEVALAHEYGHIVEESKLRPITRPEIAITKLAPGIPLAFKMTLVLEPEVTLPNYKKVAADILNTEPKEEDLEKRRVKIVEAIVKETKLELPPKFVEGEILHILNHFKQDLEKAGLKWEDYLKKAEKTEDEIKETWREHVVARAKTEFFLAKIAETEKLKTYQEVFALLEKGA